MQVGMVNEWFMYMWILSVEMEETLATARVEGDWQNYCWQYCCNH